MTTAAAAERTSVDSPLWMAAAMGKTAGASITSGLLSALGTKLIASLLGPGPVAILQTLQQLRDGAVIAATANGRTAMVQGASALEGTERREFLRTSAVLFGGGTLLVAVIMVAAPGEIARWIRLPASSGFLLPWLAGTVALLSLFVFLTGILRTLREIGALALLQVVAPLAAALVAWPAALLVRAGHPIALAFFLMAPAAATVVAGTFALAGRREEVLDWFLGAGRWWSSEAARGFLTISGALLASGLVATAVLLALRGWITRTEGLAMTGQFDAAWNISMNQVMLILGSVEAYYLPALAAAKSDGERTRHIRNMLALATLVSAPAIVALAALKPLVVSVLYSHEFSASPGFLRWTLLGDFLKVSAWVLATPLLAAREMGMFLVLELTTHLSFFGVALLLMRALPPAESAAIGFLVSYGISLGLCYGYLRARMKFRVGGPLRLIWLVSLTLVVLASASTWQDTSVDGAKAALWIAVAMVCSGGAVWYRRRNSW